MFKKIFFLVALLVFSFSVSAELNLTKQTYGADQVFSGYLSFEEDEVDLDEVISADVTECGSYDVREITLYDFLKNASLYSESLYEYEKVGSGTSSLEINFDETEKVYGFWLNSDEDIKYFNFSLDGDSSPKIDVGVNGYDWKFFGNFESWGERVYSKDFDESYLDYEDNYDSTGYDENPRYGGACSSFNISTSELQDEVLVRINGVAKRTGEGGELKGEVGGKSCVFNQSIGSGWTDVSCNVTISVDPEEEVIEKRVCIKSGQDVFRVPMVPENPEYFFISLNKAVYGGDANGEEFSSSALDSAAEDYLSENCDGWCLVPFKIYGELNSDLVFSPEIVFNNGGSTNLVYDVSQEIKTYNLTGESLSLSYFDSLRTPSVVNETCFLEVEFLSEDYTAYFNVSSGPVANIKVGSDVVAKGIPVNFDGSDSSGSGLTYSWSFGDGVNASGVRVSHSYSSEGNFTVSLTVEDSSGVENSVTKSINVADIEVVLEEEFSDIFAKINDSKERFNSYTGILKEFSNGMGFLNELNSKESEVNGLKTEFENLQNLGGNVSSAYVSLYNNLSSVKSRFPSEVVLRNSSLYINYNPLSKYDIPSFSKIYGISMNSLEGFRNDVYRYNQESVSSDYGYYLVKVDYLEGSESYSYVSKNFSSNGGDLVESSVRPMIFSSGCTYENSSSVILCSSVSGNFNLRYAVVSESLLALKPSFVIPLDAYSDVEIVYQYDCESGNCEYRYCGDGKCYSDSSLGIFESDSSNENYCPQDCGKNIPWLWYSILGVVLLFGVFWINLYRGPGNFFDVTNSISFGLFRKRLFLIEKDKLLLKDYVVRALREGFNEGEVRKALGKKGWRKKQLDYIFEELKRGKIYK